MIHTRVIGESGTVGVPPSRLVATEGTITSAQGTFTAQDYDPTAEPFISGDVTGDPGTRFFLHYPGA